MTVEAPSALEVEAATVDEIERAADTKRGAQRDRAQAEADLKRAEEDRAEAIAAGVRGERDAGKRVAAAAEAVRSAVTRRDEARELEVIAERVEQQAQRRLHDIRATLLAELAPSAELLTEEATAARDALAGPLMRYLAAHRAALRRWEELAPGTRARVEQADRERGNFDRARAKIDREALAPECPLTQELVARVLGTVARPPVMFDDLYEPDAPPERYRTPTEPMGEPTPTPLFPGSPGHQLHYGDQPHGATQAATLPDGTPAQPRAT